MFKAIATAAFVALAFGTVTAPSASADVLHDCIYANLPPLPYLGNQMSFTVCPPGVSA